jgi:hypothetical protein
MTVATLHPDLRAGVRAVLATCVGLPTGRAWEGRSYYPDPKTAFLEELLRPISSEHRSLGPGGTVQHLTTSNLTLRYPAGAGTLAVEAAAGALLAAFQPGRRITYGSTVGIVQRAERRPLIGETDWLSCTVIVSILAWTVTP